MPSDIVSAGAKPIGWSRRETLCRGLAGAGLFVAAPLLGSGAGWAQGLSSALSKIGPLREPDKSGLRLPDGFASRIVARSGQAPIPYRDFTWHGAPDGGATFPTENGGWVYVSNSEIDDGGGGVGALRFDSRAQLVDGYRILDGTSVNCAGGATPWGTWLSCEEHEDGQVWECDPLGRRDGVVRPALGTFMHEAAAVDPHRHQIYLTEDQPEGCLYRFTPHRLIDGGIPDLSSGKLEAARIVEGNEGAVDWHVIPYPGAEREATREQAPESTAFDGGEGICHHQGIVYFTTKGDNRVWAHDIGRQTIEIIYDDDLFADPPLIGVDNIAASENGDLLVAEEGGDMRIVALTPDNEIVPIVQVEGHPESSVTGPALDPSGTRLYFSSQNGESGDLEDGVTFEVTGPFTNRG